MFLRDRLLRRQATRCDRCRSSRRSFRALADLSQRITQVGPSAFFFFKENKPFRRPSCQAREEKRKFSPTATSLRRRRQRSRT